MDTSSSQERKLPASQRKLQKAREQGQVARSRDLGHLAVLAVIGLSVAYALPSLLGYLSQGLAAQLRFDANTLSALSEPAQMLQLLGQSGLHVLWLIVPLALLAQLAAVGAALASGGWTFSLQLLTPSLSKLNPLSGLARLFSRQQWLDSAKLMLLTLLLLALAYRHLSNHLGDLAQGLGMSLTQALQASGGMVRDGLMPLLLAVAGMAAIDVPLKRWQHRNQLKMSLQEVKQEQKESNGDPHIKARIRQRQREIASRRMMTAVPKADLVVMNPTHYAVALRYDETRMRAPHVVAKGADLLALRIRDLAQSSQVPVLQSPRLARALYAHAELDHEIPATLYNAVAQVLAYVYQLRTAVARGTNPAMPAPDAQVPPELDPHTHKDASHLSA